VFSFSSNAFRFCFSPWCSDLVISSYHGVFRPLAYSGFHL
jgi:hypothetical protein